MARDFLVGMLFLGSIFILVWTTVVIEGNPFNASDFRVEVYFPEVSGLVKGEEVRVRGRRGAAKHGL